MKISIVSGALAHALELDINDSRLWQEGRPITVTGTGKHPIRLAARQCKVRGELSGGIKLEAWVDAPSYSCGVWKTEKRLRAGASIYRHAADLVETLRQRRADPLVTRREALYELSERKVYDVDNLPRESSPFDDMLDPEMDFWFGWLATKTDKVSANAGANASKPA